MEQIYIGNFPSRGLTKNPLPFNIDNNAFPTMFNFYSWRGRAKRKRGTALLGQLERQLSIAAVPNNYQVASFNLIAGAGNLISQYTLGSSSSITPGSISLVVGANTYTDLFMDGTLQGSPGGTGTINYATGAITISGGGASAVTGTFSYFPGLPVMGLRDLNLNDSLFPLLLAFDTTYAYQINQSGVPFFYSVSYYKGSNNPVTWSGTDSQLFWSTNYQGAFWATNNKPGLHIRVITAITKAASAVVTLNSVTGLVIGDFVWFNEVSGMVEINGLTGEITNVNSGANQITVNINSTGFSNYTSGGIVQTLTASTAGQDGIKWYDGDPTGGTGIPTGTGKGWVNFSPPLTASTVSIRNLPAALYYLVGALLIVPYKDRLLFFSPYVQTSTGSPIQLQDVILWSWNGTAYYNTVVPDNQTFDVSAYYVDQTGKGGWLAAGIQQPIVTVTNNEDVLLVGFSQRQTRLVYTGDDLNPFLLFNINAELGASSTFSAITLDRGGVTIGRRGIVLTTQQSSERIDLEIPDDVFQIQSLNSGLDRVNSVRDYFKEWIYFAYPVNNSAWKFPTQTFLWNYRDQTWAVLYENFTAHGLYRQQTKNTWTSIGKKFKTWAQWREPWNSSSTSALFQTVVAGNPQGYVLLKGQGTGESVSGTITSFASDGGNVQITSINHCVALGDYLLITDVISTTTATITNISQATQAVVTAVNTFTAGQYVFISEVTGMTQINGKNVLIVSATGTSFTIDVDTTVFSPYTSGGLATLSPYELQIGRVIKIADANTFTLDIPFVSFTYLGLGKFTRLSLPFLQTKQFPVYWNEGRQVRLSAQKYLLDTTADGQATINIYLSQDPDNAWNDPLNNPFVPENSLIYTQTIFTCPESTNIGLTPLDTNLQMPTAQEQFQIWHRVNTSLIGDTFQIGLTLSDSQMRNLTFATSEVTLHGMVLTVDKGPHLA